MMEILNAEIKNAELTMEEHGCLSLYLTLSGSGWGVVFGGTCLGKGYLGAKEFVGSAKGTEEIMRIMDVVSPPGNIGVADGGTENLGAIVDGD